MSRDARENLWMVALVLGVLVLAIIAANMPADAPADVAVTQDDALIAPRGPAPSPAERPEDMAITAQTMTIFAVRSMPGAAKAAFQGAVYDEDLNLLGTTQVATEAVDEGGEAIVLTFTDVVAIPPAATIYVFAWSDNAEMRLTYDSGVDDGRVDSDGTGYHAWPDPANVSEEARDYSVLLTMDNNGAEATVGDATSGGLAADLTAFRGMRYTSPEAPVEISVTDVVLVDDRLGDPTPPPYPIVHEVTAKDVVEAAEPQESIPPPVIVPLAVTDVVEVAEPDQTHVSPCWGRYIDRETMLGL